MKMIDNELLSKYTSLRVGGPARRLLVPESEEELISAYKNAIRSGKALAILGRGSNTIFPDEGYDGTVILLTKACRTLKLLESKGRLWRRSSQVYAGASITLRNLIDFCIKNRLAAPTYLYSVPGNIGGAIYMNAGLGKGKGCCISESLLRVKICDGGRVRWIEYEECKFAFRKSVFSDESWLILGAEFEYDFSFRWKSKRLVGKRIKQTRKTQDRSAHNAGSIFKTGFKWLPELKGYQIGNAKYSEKVPNWILNLGGAKSSDIIQLIEHAKKLHKKNGFPEPVLEIEIKTI